MPHNILEGKKGIIFGALDDKSIAWKTAEAVKRQGGEFVLTNAPVAMRMGAIKDLADKTNSIVIPADATQLEDLENLIDQSVSHLGGKLDFVLHAIAYSDKEELKGSYVDTSRDNFARTMDISVYSFTAVARRAAAMMDGNGSLLTLTYYGAERVMPHYNVMGVAKAALEASIRYLSLIHI
mgnify:CR=1 FL=1